MSRYIGDYECKWPGCGHIFQKEFGYSPGPTGGCSAVKCPQCGAGLKPMVDAIKVTEIKEQ